MASEWLRKKAQGQNTDTAGRSPAVTGGGSNQLPQPKQGTASSWLRNKAQGQKAKASGITETVSEIAGFNDRDANLGWQKFQIDQKKQEKTEEKSWFEKAIQMLGNSGDSILPGANVTNVTNAYRNDTSYREPSDSWSDLQKKEFGYLYGRNPDEAWSYAEQVNNSIARAETEKQKTAITESATDGFWKGAAHTAGALATAPTGLADYLDNLAEMTGRGRITEKAGVTPFDYSQTVTGGISQDLNEKHGTLNEAIPVIGGKGLGDVYGIGTSIAQSALAGYTGGQIGTLVQFFGSAAAAGVDEAKRRGATDEQALMMGTLSGAAEGAAEMIGVDNLLHIGSASTMKTLLKNIAKQGVAEGLEEGITTLMNNFADQMVMKDKSNFNTMVQALVSQGMSEEAAKKQAWLSMANDLAFDMVAGFVSGAAHAGPQTAAQTVIENVYQPYRIGKTIMKSEGAVDALKQLAEEVAGASSADMHRAISEQIGKADGGSALQVGKLYDTVQTANNLVNASANQADIAKSLERKGFDSQKAKAVAEALVARYNGQELTKAQEKTLKAAKGNKDVQAAITNIMDNAKSTIGQRSENLRSFNREVVLGRLAKEQKNLSAQEENGGQSHYEVSVDGKTLDGDGNVVTIQGIASVENGKVVLQTEDGTVDAGAVSYGSRGEAQVYEAVSRLEGIIDTETANKLSRHLLKLGDVTTDTYANAIQQAYTYGYYGYGRDAMMGENTLSATLTEKQRNVAYGMGEQYRAAKTAAEDALVRKTRSNQKSQASGKVHFDGDRSALTERQNASLSAMETVAQALGVQIHVFESQVDKDGRHIGANGWYDPKDGSIHIDLHAGATGEGTMLFTAAHELTHFIRQWSPAKFKVLADFLMQEYGKKGVSVDALVREQMAKAKRNGRTIDYDTAYEEVVADSMETMLSDGKVAEKLAKLKQVDKSLWKKIKDFISDMAVKIRQVYEGMTPDSVEGRYVAEMVDSIDRLQDLFTEGLAEAGENYQSSLTPGVGGTTELVEQADRDLEAVKLSDRENPYYGKTLYKDGEIYAYDFMVALHDMEVHTMPPLSSVKTGNHVDQNKAVQLGIEDASNVGRKVSDGLFAIKNAYTGREILLGKTGLEHGLDGGDVGRLRTNARLSAIGGQIVQNAVPVNGLKNKNRQANGTYAMACLLKSGDRDVVAVVTVEEHTSKAVGIDYVDITHSINGRLRKNNEGSLSSTRETGYGLTAAPSAATFKVSIAEFLEIVNDTHRSILSQNVLDHFDEERPGDGHYADRILFSDRDSESVSNRSLLANAFEGVTQNDIERKKLQEYKGKIDQINAEERKLRELKGQIKELSFAKGPRDMKQIRMLRVEATKTANRINIYDNQLLRLEASKPLQDVLKREKKKAYQRAEQMGKEALAEYKRQAESSQQGIAERYRESRKKAVAKAREIAEKEYAKAELQKLVIDTAKWISYPAKTDVKCPDLLKQPYANFLNSIDMSSERLSKGGDPTKNDLRLANAMGSLATALERIMSSQDPNQETTEELDAGYLDLPANFVKNLREETEEVMKMMDGDDFVVNNMSAEEVRNLSQMIRTLNHAIREVSTLYANMRFANVEALGNDSMSFMEDIGEIRKTSGMKDFVQWENALPYYAFKRFGKGGEAIFEGLMDAQDKLAFLAQKIFNFQEKTWKGDEAKKWSEDTHTINLPDGEKLTLTTADAMSIYCLSRRQQGLQHLLGGGVRVVGLRKGSQKAQDSRSTLTIKDVDAIISSLTARQKKVAESIQEFMSTTCAEWGNEISMKRFLTREFNEKFYFPIESNDENLSAKDPAAQQSDLFRLLNISATKPIDPKANNEVIIRKIFDVFSSHTSDMARLNAYGLPLLDYMKWLNFREKTVSENGQIKVRGVRKYMETAYGKAAKSYVLNLIKDVNGRPSDHGLPGFYTRMVRNTKTAMVGNSLRVATLQITSYPRAALVLSPKSLALGLSKVPKISRAKKYCGIALWKSFGFYDTNISRSIEDQMKGTHDLRQKMIEWSLKGAEIGDALTWGALWNACEYEVAATKKYKVGSEEFYQAVGKKLREVVYRTQVVDSTLTRSEMMRSKNAKAQELSAFMSEPTLSANILMDAGMEFSLEKRRTDAKTAWKKTGKYVTRAIAVYSIGQLAAALMEGMWDAWRDDDDEEFSEKFADAFTENLILDILPFNKIPIISEMTEGAMSLMGIGYFSSDSLSSTAVSQSVSAVKAWTEVLKGDSSSTAYNALYKTVRAISSLLGVSVSGVMREGVAMWNNTAGAYDPTLKVLTYDRSKTELGNLLLDAIVNGDSRRADSIKGEFEDKDDYQSTLRGTIKNRYITGDLGRNTAVQYLVNYGGMGKKDAEKRVDEWDFKIKYGENYADLPDLYTSGKIDRDTAVRCLVSYGGMSEKNAKKTVSEWDFKTKYGKTYSELEDEYSNGSVSRNTIMEAMRDSGKKNFEIAEKMRTLDKEIAFTNRFGMTYNELRDSYQNGDTNRKTMYDALVFSGKTASEASDTLTEWDIENRFGIDYGKLDDAYKYGDISRQDLYNAMVENGTTHAKAQESILCYDWLKERVDEYPDLEISDARRFVIKIGDNCADYTLSDYGVSVDTYLEYVKRAKDCSGEDADGDGEIDSNSKAKQLFAMINTLPILDEQKDALAYITNAERTIKKYAPWR